jgi:hypothetical protein
MIRRLWILCSVLLFLGTVAHAQIFGTVRGKVSIRTVASKHLLTSLGRSPSWRANLAE